MLPLIIRPHLRRLTCLLWLCLCAAASPAAAEPALWSVTKDGSTVYLFGTIHIWKSDQPWETEKISTALQASTELWTELLPEDLKSVQPVIAALGVDREHPLSSKLTKQDLALLDKTAKRLELPNGRARLEPMRPWMAALTFTVLPLLRAGYDPAEGIDSALQSQAKADGKRLLAFETPDMQVQLFADMPPAIELEMLHSALEDAQKSAEHLQAIANAWQAGDVPALEAGLIGLDQKKYADFYKRLFTDRNQAWADRIAALLKEGGETRFVAVGAGHLAGPDSLQHALEQRGLTVVRD